MREETPPPKIVQDLAVAFWASRCLHVVAELGIADVLGDEAESADTLARSSGVNPQALHRVLRSLANHGIFTHDGERFAHNSASRLLRTDVPGSMRSLARMMGLKMHWDAYRELDVGLRTGKPAISAVVEGGLFGYLRAHPEEGRLFHEAMAGKSFAQVGPIIAAYDFSPFATIGDIGGGLGHLLNAVLERAPQASGVLFDLPQVIEHARPQASPRVSYVGGDFFKNPIPPCDLYMLMTVLHDWSDEEAIAILKNIKAGAPPAAKVLILEGVVQPEAHNNFLLDLDIEMLVMTTGRERTEKEWRAVIAGAGMKLARMIQGSASIIEVEMS
jgi:nucleotide-binding universal stress UspA family protein